MNMMQQNDKTEIIAYFKEFEHNNGKKPQKIAKIFGGRGTCSSSFKTQPKKCFTGFKN